MFSQGEFENDRRLGEERMGELGDMTESTLEELTSQLVSSANVR